jgi:hypothetical protein
MKAHVNLGGIGGVEVCSRPYVSAMDCPILLFIYLPIVYLGSSQYGA